MPLVRTSRCAWISVCALHTYVFSSPSLRLRRSTGQTSGPGSPGSPGSHHSCAWRYGRGAASRPLPSIAPLRSKPLGSVAYGSTTTVQVYVRGTRSLNVSDVSSKACGVASGGVAVRPVQAIVAAVPPGTCDSKDTVMFDNGVLWKVTLSPT